MEKGWNLGLLKSEKGHWQRDDIWRNLWVKRGKEDLKSLVTPRWAVAMEKGWELELLTGEKRGWKRVENCACLEVNGALKFWVTPRWILAWAKRWNLVLLRGEKRQWQRVENWAYFRWMMGKIWGYSRVNNGIREEVKCGVTKRWKEAKEKGER